MKDDLHSDGFWWGANDQEQQCIRTLYQLQLGMQALKDTNIGFVCPQKFISRLQKVETLNTKAKITKQFISSISSILDCSKLAWLKNVMSLFKSPDRQFSFLAIGGMLFWTWMIQLQSPKIIPTEEILKVFGDIAESLDERWLVNGSDVCESMTMIFIRELRKSIYKMDLSCMTDIEKQGLNFLFLQVQVVPLPVQVWVTIHMNTQMMIRSNL